MSIDYKQLPIPAAAIAELLCAGMAEERGAHFALFTGGGNGCGKSTFLQRSLAPELAKTHGPRDMEAFYETVARLHASGALFNAIEATDGHKIWEQMLHHAPELKAIESYPVPLINMDMIGYLLDECVQDKRQLGQDFLISDHYYRALNAAPELVRALAERGHSFVVDSTMSNPQKICEAANTAASHGHSVQYAVLTASPDVAIARAKARAQEDGRHISDTNLRASQRKMPANFWEFCGSARKHGGFIGLYDTSASDGSYRMIAYSGHSPAFACQNPQGETLHRTENARIIATDPKAYGAFRYGVRPDIRAL